MLPSDSNIACLGALTYTAIASNGGDSDRLIQAHKTVNRKVDLNKSMIIFPCRTRYHYMYHCMLCPDSKYCVTSVTTGTG